MQTGWLKPSGSAADLVGMRHFRLWLVMIGVVSLVAEAVAAAAIFWRGSLRARRPGGL